MAPLDSWAHFTSETCNVFKISKFDLFWPDLDLYFDFVYDEIKLNDILTMSSEFYV